VYFFDDIRCVASFFGGGARGGGEGSKVAKCKNLEKSTSSDEFCCKRLTLKAVWLKTALR
jgi:hypothetical protein